MIIRKAVTKDLNAIWEIFHQVVKEGYSYVFHPDTPRTDLDKYWTGPEFHVWVAEINNKVVGSYYLKPNYTGLGSHIANAGYCVHNQHIGSGIGKQMCEHSINSAKELGFKAMQFNFVVASNHGAIKIWEQFDFKIIGTIPNAFQHQKLGLTDAHIMYRSLE